VGWGDSPVLSVPRSGDEAAPSVTCSWVPTTLTLIRKPKRGFLYSDFFTIRFNTMPNCHLQTFYLFASTSEILATVVTTMAGQCKPGKHMHAHT
jgi:hypothetical protein